MKTCRTLIPTTAALGMLLLPAPARAATYLWANPAGGDWAIPANWGAASWPRQFFDFALFGIPGAYDVLALDPTRVSAIGGIGVEGGSVTLRAHPGLRALVSAGLSGEPATLTLREGGITGFGAHYIGTAGSLVLAPGTRLLAADPSAPGLVVERGGTLRGDGAAFDGGALMLHGTIAPGLAPASAGTLRIADVLGGGIQMQPGAVLDMEIGAVAPGTGHDQIVAGAPVRLAGTLRVTLLPGAAPADGDRYDLVLAPSLDGAFDAIELPNVPGLRFEAVPAPGRVVVTVTRDAVELAVTLDIRPGTCDNPLQTRSHGVLPAAIAAAPGVDLAAVDPASLRLEGVAPLRWSREDVTSPEGGGTECTDSGPDGAVDLGIVFDVDAIVAALGPVVDGETRELRLAGALRDGTPITAADVVRVRVAGVNRADASRRGPGEARAAIVEGPGAITPLDASPGGEVRVRFALARSGSLVVDCFDVRGRRVARVLEAGLPAGESETGWHAPTVASGVYFYRVVAAGATRTIRVVIRR